MHGSDPELAAKLVKAIDDACERVGGIHKIEEAPVYGMPGLRVSLTWLVPKEDADECPDVRALDLLIPGSLVTGAVKMLKEFEAGGRCADQAAEPFP